MREKIPVFLGIGAAAAAVVTVTPLGGAALGVSLAVAYLLLPAVYAFALGQVALAVVFGNVSIEVVLLAEAGLLLSFFGSDRDTRNKTAATFGLLLFLVLPLATGFSLAAAAVSVLLVAAASIYLIHRYLELEVTGW